MTVWCNGEIVDQLNLDPAERGLLLGDGVFETLAVRGGKVIWLEEHLARLELAAHELGLRPDLTAIHVALLEVLRTSQSHSEALRITLTRGPTNRGLAADGEKPSLVISLNPLDATKLPTSVRLATCTIRRNATSPASRLKTLSYIDAIAAAREVAAHADDALMLNTEGNVACSTVANIFMLKDKKLITPDDGQGILKGITRGKLIAAGPELGVNIECRVVKSEEFMAADAIFITNSLRLAVPVTSLDGAVVGTRSIDFINALLISES